MVNKVRRDHLMVPEVVNGVTDFRHRQWPRSRVGAWAECLDGSKLYKAGDGIQSFLYHREGTKETYIW